MNTLDVHNLKSRLDDGETIELHSSQDLAYLRKSKITKDYLFVFNAKPLFGYKKFSTFVKKANGKVKQYALVESIEQI